MVKGDNEISHLNHSATGAASLYLSHRLYMQGPNLRYKGPEDSRDAKRTYHFKACTATCMTEERFLWRTSGGEALSRLPKEMLRRPKVKRQNLQKSHFKIHVYPFSINQFKGFVTPVNGYVPERKRTKICRIWLSGDKIYLLCCSRLSRSVCGA